MRAVWVWSITLMNTVLFWLLLQGVKLQFGDKVQVIVAAVMLIVGLVWLFWLKVWKE